MFARLKVPLVALILGIIPFFLFIGSQQTTTVNGELIVDSRLNFGGIVLSLIGLGLVIGFLRPRSDRHNTQRSMPITLKLLAVVASLVCIAQFIVSIDLVRPSDVFGTQDDPVLQNPDR